MQYSFFFINPHSDSFQLLSSPQSRHFSFYMRKVNNEVLISPTGSSYFFWLQRHTSVDMTRCHHVSVSSGFVLPLMSHSVSPSAAEPDGAAGDQCWTSSVFPGRRPGSEEEQSGTEWPGGPEELTLPVHPAPLPGEAGQEQQGSKSVIFHKRLCLYVHSVSEGF